MSLTLLASSKPVDTYALPDFITDLQTVAAEEDLRPYRELLLSFAERLEDQTAVPATEAAWIHSLLRSHSAEDPTQGLDTTGGFKVQSSDLAHGLRMMGIRATRNLLESMAQQREEPAEGNIFTRSRVGQFITGKRQTGR